MLRITVDERREVLIPGDTQETLDFSAKHFITLASNAIKDHGAFFVALSGGSTPKALYERLTTRYSKEVPWEKIHFFWSDERAAPPSDAENNYHMAMEAGLKNMPIPFSHLHRMQAEGNIQKAAVDYESEIQKTLGNHPFDCVMLGMGDDGHTASLFPHTEALKVQGKKVAANFVPQKNVWRLTLTYEAINSAKHIVIYVLGSSKKAMLQKVLHGPAQYDLLPLQKVGTKEHKALYIADKEAYQ